MSRLLQSGGPGITSLTAEYSKLLFKMIIFITLFIKKEKKKKRKSYPDLSRNILRIWYKRQFSRSLLNCLGRKKCCWWFGSPTDLSRQHFWSSMKFWDKSCLIFGFFDKISKFHVMFKTHKETECLRVDRSIKLACIRYGKWQNK